MVGLPILSKGSDSDFVENVVSDENKTIVISDDDDDVVVDIKISHDNGNNVASNGKANHESEDGVVRLRALFDEVMSLFIEANGNKGMLRPLPAILDGKETLVDMFTLFCVVRGKGGYASVSKRLLWGFVARELGLRVRESATVKLLYFKYLIELERWVDERESFCGPDGNFGRMSSELEAEFRGLLSEIVLPQLEDAENVGNGDLVGSELNVNLGEDDIGKDNKRKRECLSKMLRWLAEVAKLSSGRSFEEDCDGKEFFSQGIKAREAMLVRSYVDTKTSGGSQRKKKPKMHPSMYEDIVTCNRPSRSSRSSNRVPQVPKPRQCASCNRGSANPHKASSHNCNSPVVPPQADFPPATVVKAVVSSIACSAPKNAPVEKSVSVGPQFQAIIPEWTGRPAAHESDPKWLGTRIWPPPGKPEQIETAGNGRRGSCRCSTPGSGECVRLHVAETKRELKLELGTVFFLWRFHQMGEEVSLGWDPLEEARFKEVVKSGRSFSDRQVWWLLQKTRASLVSYYFNVFLVQKRSYQNRVSPHSIDSDNDEAEFGSIGGRFGHSFVDDLVGPGTETCAQNMQCAELDASML